MDRAQVAGAALLALGALGIALGIEFTREAWGELSLQASAGGPQSMEGLTFGLVSALLMVLGVTAGVVGGFLLRAGHRL